MYHKIIISLGGQAFETIVRDGDGAHIPPDALNTDWQAFQDWVKGGNTPAELDASPAS